MQIQAFERVRKKSRERDDRISFGNSTSMQFTVKTNRNETNGKNMTLNIVQLMLFFVSLCVCMRLKIADCLLKEFINNWAKSVPISSVAARHSVCFFIISSMETNYLSVISFFSFRATFPLARRHFIQKLTTYVLSNDKPIQSTFARCCWNREKKCAPPVSKWFECERSTISDVNWRENIPFEN